MRKVLLVAKRDYLAAVRTKAFLVGLVVAPVIFGGSIFALALFKDQKDIRDRRIAVIDRTGELAEALVAAAGPRNARQAFDAKTGRQVGPKYLFEAVPPGSEPAGQRLELSGRVRSRELYGFIEIEPAGQDKSPRMAFYTQAGTLDPIRQWIAEPVNERLHRLQMARLGVPQQHFARLYSRARVETLNPVTRDSRTGQVQAAQKVNELQTVMAPAGLVLLLVMVVLTGATPLLAAVSEEKTQRIAEVLLCAVRPFELMAGKVIAALAVSLTGSIVYIAAGTAAVLGMNAAGMAPFHLLPWFFAYLVAEVLILSTWSAALGSACSSLNDLQRMGMLTVAPVMVPMFLIGPFLVNPHSTLATALSLFPPFTPVIMLLRQASPGGVPAWQPWVGLAGVIVYSVLFVWAAGRVFRVAILMQCKPPQLNEMIRWALRG